MAQNTKTREAATKADGAAFRLEPSPYGNKALRAEWQARLAERTTLAEALALLVAYRADQAAVSVNDQDALWIEARMEEKVAVLRFDSMTTEEVRTRTLTGEVIADVCADFIGRAEAAADDAGQLEALNREFRGRYRPPIMLSSPFLRTETVLAEHLMKERSLDWYGRSIEELRDHRQVVVHKTGD